MEKLRDALETGHIIIHDIPQLPIKILIDDIEQEVIKAEPAGCVPRQFIFKRRPYPPSHHVT